MMAHNLYHYKNVSNSIVWVETNIAPNSYPSHLLQMVDINRDGNPDMISESAGHSVISYYENQAPPVCDPVDVGFDLTVVDPAHSGNGKPGWSASWQRAWTAPKISGRVTSITIGYRTL